MGIFSDIFGGGDDRLPEEKAVDREQHRAWRTAGNQAAKAHRDNHMVHDQLTEAVADAEQHVSFWRW